MSSAKKIRELNRAKTEHDNAKLSAQIAKSNHTMLNIAESILVNELEKLRAENEALKQQVEQGKRDAVPEDWVAVPKESTPKMEKAGGHVNSEWLNDNAPIGEARYGFPMPGVWKAMIAAAPKQEK